MIERRLPVYLLLDVSGSMDGVPIQAVNDGIQQLVSGLRADRFAVEKVWLSIITFGNEAKQIVPLTWLEDFQMPNLVADGMTALGPALSLLCECREREVVKATAERRGDYSPVVIVLTDGCPTEDDFEKGVGDFKAMKWGNCICCGIGPEADMESLKRISDAVLHLPSEGELSGEDVASVFKRGINFRYF